MECTKVTTQQTNPDISLLDGGNRWARGTFFLQGLHPWADPQNDGNSLTARRGGEWPHCRVVQRIEPSKLAVQPCHWSCEDMDEDLRDRRSANRTVKN
jgi:hypothetical protein